jgi:hypothetical protein
LDTQLSEFSLELHDVDLEVARGQFGAAFLARIVHGLQNIVWRTQVET